MIWIQTWILRREYMVIYILYTYTQGSIQFTLGQICIMRMPAQLVFDILTFLAKCLFPLFINLFMIQFSSLILFAVVGLMHSGHSGYGKIIAMKFHLDA